MNDLLLKKQPGMYRLFEPHHEKICLCYMHTTKAQIRLISTFVVGCLDSIIALVSISEISSLYLAALAAQAGLCLTWLQTPKTCFLVTRLVYVSVDVYNKHACFHVIILVAFIHVGFL